MMNMFTKELAQSKHKRQINEYLAKTGNKRGIAIVLDSKILNTYRTLLRYKWRKKQIFVPNNGSDCVAIRKRTQNCFNMSIGQYLKKCKHNIGLVYMDYMGSFYGNKDCSPKDDIETLFKCNLTSSCLVGMTYSFRANKKQMFRHKQLIDVIGTVLSVATKHGYKIIIDKDAPCGSYTNNHCIMFTLIFKIL